MNSSGGLCVFVFRYVDDCQRRRHFKRLKAADGWLVWTDANIHIDGHSKSYFANLCHAIAYPMCAAIKSIGENGKLIGLE